MRYNFITYTTYYIIYEIIIQNMIKLTSIQFIFVEKERQGQSSFSLLGTNMIWNQGSSYDDQNNSILSSSSLFSTSSKLLTRDNGEGKAEADAEKIQFEYEKLILKNGEEELKNCKKFERIVENERLVSTSSLPRPTYYNQNDTNENSNSRSLNMKNDNSRTMTNKNKMEKIGDYGKIKIDSFETNSSSNVWNLRVQGLSDDGKLLVIEDVDWTWQRGDLNRMSDGEREDMEVCDREEEWRGGTREGRSEGGIEFRLSHDKNKDGNKEMKSMRKEQTTDFHKQHERTSSKSPYLQGVTHLCIHFMSYSSILSEVASNAHTLPNISSLTLFNNDLSTIKQVPSLFNQFVSLHSCLF